MLCNECFEASKTRTKAAIYKDGRYYCTEHYERKYLEPKYEVNRLKTKIKNLKKLIAAMDRGGELNDLDKILLESIINSKTNSIFNVG